MTERDPLLQQVQDEVVHGVDPIRDAIGIVTEEIIQQQKLAAQTKGQTPYELNGCRYLLWATLHYVIKRRD